MKWLHDEGSNEWTSASGRWKIEGRYYTGRLTFYLYEEIGGTWWAVKSHRSDRGGKGERHVYRGTLVEAKKLVEKLDVA